jgi:TonB family protein
VISKITLVINILFINVSHAQLNQSSLINSNNYEVGAIFPNRDAGLMKYLLENQQYPKLKPKEELYGTVYIKFTIDTLGKVQNVKVERGIKNGALLNSEAIRVVENMPQWIPAKKKSKPIESTYIFPINFNRYNHYKINN